MDFFILFAQGCLMWIIALSAWWRPFSWFLPETLDTVSHDAGIFLDVLGLVILLIAIFTLKTNLTVFVEPKKNLITNGIYRLSRNPIYLGATLIAFGWSLANLSTLGVLTAIVLSATLNIKIRMEEKNLEIKFGRPYKDYCARTRRWL